MKNSKQILKKANVIPKLQLAVKKEGGGVLGTGPHTVVLVSDEVVKGTDFRTGKERFEVKYTVKENGDLKTYNVPVKDKTGGVHYLVQRLAELPEGSTVTLEYKRNGLVGYIDVSYNKATIEEKTVNIDDVPDTEEASANNNNASEHENLSEDIDGLQ